MTDPTADLRRFELTVEQATALQRASASRVVLAPPAGFMPTRVAGLDVSMEKFAEVGYAGVVVLEQPGLRTIEEASVAAPLTFPYVPGLLSFRELPLVVAAWERITTKPDVLIFDGQGYAHPRRFGIACHGGLLFGVPSVGCAKSILVGRHGPLAPERGSTAPLEHRGEVVGMAVRLRDRVNPVYVSPGHLMDVETAVQVVMSVSAGYREPETTRRAHKLVNDARKRAKSQL